MPSDADQRRAAHQRARAQILEEEHDELVDDWISQHVSEERMAAWGMPDTSANPLADIVRQLTTPGLYGLGAPEVRHSDAAAAPLTNPGGVLARYWSRVIRVQYLAVGMGDMLVRLRATATGRLVARNVWPHDVMLFGHPEEPDHIQALWELRLRTYPMDHEQAGEYVWTWDVYDLAQELYAVVEAKRDGTWGADLSALFLSEEGALQGPAYPYRFQTGEAFLPFIRYRPTDSGALWNHMDKRGAARGTLNSVLYHTYTGQCARDATGSAVLTVGVAPPGVEQQDVGRQEHVATVQLVPGAMMFLNPAPGFQGQPVIQTIGPGANLQSLADFTGLYDNQQAVRWGLSPSDLQRTHNDPMSGAALFISNKGKREYAAQVTEPFRGSDLDAISKVAALLNRATGLNLPETGYTLTYRQIPKAPDEMAGEREEESWQEEKGLLSPLDLYLRRHPGASEEDALRAIVKARVDKARIEAAVADALAALSDITPQPPQEQP